MADKRRPHTRFTDTRSISLICVLLLGVLAYGITSFSQQPSGGDRAERTRSMSRGAEERGLAEPFKGVTTDGNVVTSLFPIRSTDLDRARPPAGEALATLTPEQRAKTMFSLTTRNGASDEPALLRPAGHGFQGMTEAPARGRLRVAARLAEREGIEAIARHHAAQPHAGRAEQ